MGRLFLGSRMNSEVALGLGYEQRKRSERIEVLRNNKEIKLMNFSCRMQNMQKGGFVWVALVTHVNPHGLFDPHGIVSFFFPLTRF